MFFPRFKLSAHEEKAGAVKYYDHSIGKRGVLRKFYGGQLSLTQTQRVPVFNFQIARRCRVFALTASGDIGQFKITLQDSSGEHYLAQPVTLASLLGGYVEIPPPAFATPLGPTGGYPPTNTDAASTVTGYAAPIGQPKTYAPFVFEPSIQLDSNQTLTMTGYPMVEYNNVNFRVDVTFHVWEFPSWNNGPA